MALVGVTGAALLVDSTLGRESRRHWETIISLVHRTLWLFTLTPTLSDQGTGSVEGTDRGDGLHVDRAHGSPPGEADVKGVAGRSRG